MISKTELVNHLVNIIEHGSKQSLLEMYNRVFLQKITFNGVD